MSAFLRHNGKRELSIKQHKLPAQDAWSADINLDPSKLHIARGPAGMQLRGSVHGCAAFPCARTSSGETSMSAFLRHNGKRELSIKQHKLPAQDAWSADMVRPTMTATKTIPTLPQLKKSTPTARSTRRTRASHNGKRELSIKQHKLPAQDAWSADINQCMYCALHRRGATDDDSDEDDTDSTTTEEVDSDSEVDSEDKMAKESSPSSSTSCQRKTPGVPT
jgi:hypothetical protein